MNGNHGKLALIFCVAEREVDSARSVFRRSPELDRGGVRHDPL